MRNILSFLKRYGFGTAFGALAVTLFYYGWEALGDVVDEIPQADQDIFMSLIEKIESGVGLTDSEADEFNRIHGLIEEYAYESTRSFRMFFWSSCATAASIFTFKKCNES